MAGCTVCHTIRFFFCCSPLSSFFLAIAVFWVHEGTQQLREAAASTRARGSVKFWQLFACILSSSWLLLSSEPSPTFSSHVKQPQIIYTTGTLGNYSQAGAKTHCYLTTCPCDMLVSVQFFEKKWLRYGSLPIKLCHFWRKPTELIYRNRFILLWKTSRHVLAACW